MLKNILWFFLILFLLGVIYFALGLFDFVPFYHCDTAMGPKGEVNWCQWYFGMQRIY